MARASDTGGGDSKHALGFSQALGRTIKVVRTDLGMERRELAARAGISYSYLTEIENGNKPPSSSVLAPIASALGLRMSRLIDAAEARMERQSAAAQPALPELAGRPSTAALEALRPQTVDAIWDTQISASAPGGPSRVHGMQSALRASHRDARAAAIELERLLRDMSPEDIERVLEYARWVGGATGE
jgi:transcriptional regulator with XRE-family HTH domain